VRSTTRRIPVPEEAHGDPVADLWDEYAQRHALEVRERLILHYAPLVKFVAGRVASGLPQSVD
jgi:RNA polymerase sigma factor FliA